MKTVFRKIRGRIIPIRVGVGQDEFANIYEVQRARAAMKGKRADKLYGTFLRYTQQRSKKTGRQIGKRIARLKRNKTWQ